ncbi:hypothetical protein [Sporosarcina sp. E16_8]|uniref:hypothetical protein n=1 Tax=Sporosarcina sp. E16_8 TaxID=2789295 RepID=UPI001A9209FA|nr:hypothetical protein [Sporosarcina sp. E16_8]MBO0588002.1 hypothetical protein [Sporosarcina sp. E16_8]
MNGSVKVYAITEFGLGARGSSEGIVDFQTAQLMMGADIVRINDKTYRVKYREVTEGGKINFYSEEIIRKSFSELKLCEIE